MDIVKALKQEEAKLEKQAKHAAKHLAAVRDAIKAFGGSLTVGAKALIGKKKRKLSAWPGEPRFRRQRSCAGPRFERQRPKASRPPRQRRGAVMAAG